MRRVSRLTEVERSDEEHVNAINSSDLIYNFEGLFRLDLHDSQERVVGLLQILHRSGLSGKALRGQHGAKAPFSLRGVFGVLDNIFGILHGAQKRHDDLSRHQCTHSLVRQGKQTP